MQLSSNKQQNESRIKLDSIIVRNPEQLFSEVDDEVVMLNVEKGEYYNLDGTGENIWKLISEPISVKALIHSLTEIYNISFEACAKDVKPFITELIENGIVIKK